MVSFPKPKRPPARRPKRAKFKTAQQGKRVVVCFGPPGSGVSTVLDCLSRASQTSNQVVPYLGRQSLRQVEEALQHVDVVFLDVDGGLLGPSDIQDLVDGGLISHTSGAVIRLYCPDEDIIHRTQDRPGYVSVEDLQLWAQDIGPLEELVRLHSLPYFNVPNFDLIESVKQIAMRSGVMD